MKDVQSSIDTRNIFIDNVGISDIKYPILFKNNDVNESVTAKFELSVSLSKEIRGTHMSRFVEVLNNIEVLSSNSIESFLKQLKDKLHSDSVYINTKFIFFATNISPVSKIESLIDIDVEIDSSFANNKIYKFITYSIPVTTLCPCSKEISNFGAHNQRADIKIKVEYCSDTHNKIINEISNLASSKVYSLLKRVDEKYVTENAYTNPKFVEDVTRDIAIYLNENSIKYEFIEVKSYESIHNHIAFARILG